MKRIESVCRRRFPDGNDADECYVFVIDRLQADDYSRIRQFKGKSSIQTYLYAVINALAADYKRKKYGRKRIPKAVAQLGEWAEVIYRLVCWRKYSFAEAYDIVLVEGHFQGTYERFLEKTDPIRQAPCPENPRFIAVDDSQMQALSHMDVPPSNPLEELLQKTDGKRRAKAASIIRDATERLSDEEQLLVRLVYGSDQSVRAAARVIGLKAGAARRLLKRVLLKYRENLLAEGIREI
ncbi:MAG: sigma-70 family RNA polymerase sigma factor [Deltaproteobacteria bacterium]|nr:sigma-70 family RNA polymerase sigma factor [Deltaproteobacteria bacterium]MBW2283872.1 sigma-70 family RNA polymerase sigma factor [Deltaproteobacteria bacterium]